jgi:hypothetical protein
LARPWKEKVMRNSTLVLLAALALPLAANAQSAAPSSTPATQAANVPAYVTKAIDDPARAADRKDDARRQIAAVMTVAGV